MRLFGRPIALSLAAATAVCVGLAPVAMGAPGPVASRPAASEEVQAAGWVCLPMKCWWRPAPLPTWVPRSPCDPCYVRGRRVWGGVSYWWYSAPDWGGF